MAQWGRSKYAEDIFIVCTLAVSIVLAYSKVNFKAQNLMVVKGTDEENGFKFKPMRVDEITLKVSMLGFELKVI